MALKEKIHRRIKYHTGLYKSNLTKEISELADDHAIEFAEWLLLQDITQRGKNNFVCADGIQRSTKELLEIFKKEKGL